MDTAFRYPDNLLTELFSYEIVRDDSDDLPPFVSRDCEACLAYLMHTLTERERVIVELRFKEGQTYEQVGKAFGVTRERIRQVEQKALRKLRSPSRMDFLVHGMAGVIQQKVEDRIREERSEIYAEAGRFLNEAIGQERTEAFLKGAARPKDAEPARALNMPIDGLGLSVRSHNCLLRAGVETVGDIVRMGREKLMRVRNLGGRSLQEIENTLATLGVKLEEGAQPDAVRQDGHNMGGM